jgi:hypothetical protein
MRKVVTTAVLAVLFVVMIGATKAEAATPPATITGVSCRGEWIDIKNTSGASLNLRSFRLHDHNKVNKYDFFRLILPPGASVRIWAGGGRNGPYTRWRTGWNQRILSDTGDRVTLLNARRRTVSARNCGDEGGPAQPPPNPPPGNCHPSYTPCVQNVAGDLDCADVGHSVTVIGPDKYGLDTNDPDNIGCESY